MDKLLFSQISNQIINNLEGGYYNPQWHYKKAMGDSGETMFGIDRKHGGSLNTSSAGKEFWTIIDQNKNQGSWFHGYMGGPLETTLKSKVVNIMFPYYQELANTYLNKDLIKIVNTDPRLLLHFAYASWNGSGWFQRFAKLMNARWQSGERNADVLYQGAINDRKNSSNTIIARSGSKIETIFKKFKDGKFTSELPEFTVKGKKKFNLIWIALAVLGGYYYAKKRKRTKK